MDVNVWSAQVAALRHCGCIAALAGYSVTMHGKSGVGLWSNNHRVCSAHVHMGSMSLVPASSIWRTHVAPKHGSWAVSARPLDEEG